ncbi:hypothetical protein [Corynebacterium propinquum]
MNWLALFSGQSMTSSATSLSVLRSVTVAGAVTRRGGGVVTVRGDGVVACVDNPV